ncbi:helix-turn-helix domain-containing protein [Paenibacillus thalictri]|uniref:AraC family transcriptional regulator n=1 Tax=Paenibacillus thalictri TaxID=2527873 RepID=A0A4Q9DJ83_9BACL|nr:helix-turn-helix domain-containing protein [Paenibacillus thalictri]TBL73926.1 AraC family transcriptional regulator [Paenibacillus thalictri]
MGRRKTNSVLNRWIRSYALIMLIPIIIMVVVYIQTKHVIEDEINRANSALLTQLQQDIDNHIDYTYRLSEMISLNPRVRQLMRTPEHLEAEDRIAMVQALADFRTYNSTNRYVDHFYVYFKMGGFVLTESSYYDTSMYYDLRLSETSLSPNGWKQFLGKTYRGQFINMQEVKGQANTGILFAQSLPIDERNTPLATLIIELNEEKLLSAIRNIQAYNQGNVYILDGTNHILASSERDHPGLPDFANLNGELGFVQGKSNGEDVVVSFIQSNRTNWKYVYVLPSRLYSEKAEYIRNLTLLMLAAAVLICAALAVWFARQNYVPLRRLVRSLAERSKLDPGAALNEYDYIEEAIENTMDRNHQMNQMIEKQKNVLRSNLFIRLLKGRTENDFPVREALAEYNVSFRAGPFAVVLIFLEDFSGFFRPHETDLEKKREMVRLIISNIVEELSSKTHQGWVVEIDELLACILNVKPQMPAEEAEHDVLRMIEEAQRFIASRFHIYFTAAVSKLHESPAGLPAAYQEAIEAMEYRMLLGTQTIISYEQIKRQIMSYVYPLDKEQQLINYVKAGEFALAKAVLDEVLHVNLTGQELSIEMVRCLMFDMISTMMKAAMEANLGQTELYEENRKAIQELMSGITVAAMKERMTLFLNKVCNHVDSRKKSHNFRLKEDVLEFIHDQYSDHNMSVNTISEKFGIHPSYLSRYFKEQVGDTLTDYINKLRVEKSKQLLRNDEILIKDICDSVGFYSISTFIRLFKKYEGVTPSLYRESSKY